MQFLNLNQTNVNYNIKGWKNKKYFIILSKLKKVQTHTYVFGNEFCPFVGKYEIKGRWE